MQIYQSMSFTKIHETANVLMEHSRKLNVKTLFKVLKRIKNCTITTATQRKKWKSKGYPIHLSRQNCFCSGQNENFLGQNHTSFSASLLAFNKNSYPVQKMFCLGQFSFFPDQN